MSKPKKPKKSTAKRLVEEMLRHGSPPPREPQVTGKAGGLHITIGVAPDNNAGLTHELQLVKAALLYADGVTLCSPTVAMLENLQDFDSMSRKQNVKFYESIIPDMFRDDKVRRDQAKHNIERYKTLFRRGNRLSPSEEEFVRFVDNNMATMKKQVADDNRQRAQVAGIDKLILAVNSGLLTLQQFDMSSGGDDMPEQFFDFVKEAVTDGKTYPLFDDTTHDLVRTHVNEGLMTVSEVAVGRGKHIGLVGGLMERLPIFEEATIDELLDIKKELSRPLDRFRGALIGFSEDIAHAAWDTNFAHDVETVYYKDIIPAMKDIEDAVSDNSALRHLFPSIKKTLPVAGPASALGIFLSGLGNLQGLLGAMLSTGVAVGSVVEEVIREYHDKQNAIERTQLYFYYKVRKDLQHR